MKSLEERFWEKVEKTDGCWLWTAYKNADGYGKFRISGKSHSAHRFSWILHNGPIPELPDTDYRGTCVLHRCDTPPCVNPDHLFLGSQLDNMVDRGSKDRQAHQPGETNPRAILTELEVSSIRTLYGHGGYTQKELGIKFGCGRSTVSHIVNNKTWKNLKEK